VITRVGIRLSELAEEIIDQEKLKPQTVEEMRWDLMTN
jgi:hypothetical protein